jgi:hypothetical protein
LGEVVGKFSSLMRAIVGDISPTLSKWIQAVSAFLDNPSLQAQATPVYAIVRRATTTQSFNAPTDLVLNWPVAMTNGIEWDPITGHFTLQPGMYELEFYGRFQDFDDPEANFTVEWVNKSDDQAIAFGCDAVYDSFESVGSVSAKPVTRVLWRFGGPPQVVAPRVTAVSIGGAKLSVNSYAMIRKVG